MQSFDEENILDDEGGIEEMESVVDFEGETGADMKVKEVLISRLLVSCLLISFSLTPISPLLILLLLSFPVSPSNPLSKSSSISTISYNRDLGIVEQGIADGDITGTSSGCIGGGRWLWGMTHPLEVDAIENVDRWPALAPTVTGVRFANGSSSRRNEGGGELRDGFAIDTFELDVVVTDDERTATGAIDAPATEFEVEVRLGTDVPSPGTEEAAAAADPWFDISA